MAERVRDHASDLAEWIAPELAPPGKQWKRQQMSAAHALLLATLIIALALGAWSFASKAFGEPSGPVIMRASSF